MLRGMGLVVGLNGTGEANDRSTMRAIARAMEIMGNPVANADRPEPAARRAQEDEERGAGDGDGDRAGDRGAARRSRSIAS